MSRKAGSAFGGKKINYYLVLIFCCFLIFFVCQQALALDVGLQYGGQSGLGTKDLRVTIAEVVRTAMGILGIIDFILLLLSGFYFMLSRDDPERMKKAKEILTAALIGLVIIMSSFALASFILSMLIENGGAQQPVGNGNVNGGGLVNGNFNGNGNQIPNINGSFPAVFNCIGSIPANTNVCPSPNATELTANTQNELVPSCSNDPTKCEYVCQLDFYIENGSCVNGYPSNYQAYYSFTTGANDLSSNHFDGIVYKGDLTPDPNPLAISDGNLNLDGSHFVRVNNFSIGPSFTAIARAKSDTNVWNIDGWIISTQNANGFLIHPDSNTTAWSGYIYNVNGNRNSYILVGSYSLSTEVKITDWHTYGLQYDSGSGVAKMIFDDRVVITKTFTPAIDRGTTNRNIIIDIGHDIFASDPRFGKGKIDWFYIYNRTLY
ncbi:MAG: hypothetical protein NT116_06575 [Candidatus Parcubacteria bacterium]|nr:hypothetical protein [Candidatus Parcubacteria bacterium]